MRAVSMQSALEVDQQSNTHLQSEPMHKALNRVATLAAALLLFVGTSAAAQSPLEQARQAVADADFPAAARFYDQAVKDAPKDRDVLVEAADVNMELERYNVARQLYERAVEVNRKDAEASRKLALAFSALGEHPRAFEAIRQALKYDEEAMANYLAMTEVYIAFGKDSLSRAELTAMNARNKYPEAAEPYLSLGDLYFARGVYELAMTQYEEAIKRNPALVEPRVRLGRSYREMAKRSTDATERNEFYNKALQEFNKVTGLNPKIARPWYEQGEILLMAERYRDAGTSFENYTKLRPDDPRGDLMLARAAFGGNFYVQAVPALERMLERNDSLSSLYHAQARQMLAKSYMAVKDFPKAVAMYRLVPDSAMDAEATKFYGAALINTGDTLGALAVYTRVTEQNPKDCETSLQLGNMLYKMKRYDQVVDVFTRRIANCPEQPAATPYLFIGLSQFSMKRYDEAIAALGRSIAADSASPQAFQSYYWLMNANAAKKDFAAAAAVARTMEKRGYASDAANAQGMATGYFFIGLEAFQAKKYKEAIDAMEKATKLKSDYADAYLYSGFAYHSLTDKENACKHYKLALRYSPNNKDAQKNLKALGCE
jgi:tetratricopeptide (TPR) repeat protein